MAKARQFASGSLAASSSAPPAPGLGPISATASLGSRMRLGSFSHGLHPGTTQSASQIGMQRWVRNCRTFANFDERLGERASSASHSLSGGVSGCCMNVYVRELIRHRASGYTPGRAEAAHLRLKEFAWAASLVRWHPCLSTLRASPWA